MKHKKETIVAHIYFFTYLCAVNGIADDGPIDKQEATGNMTNRKQ